MFNSKKPRSVETDVSDYAIAAVLKQLGDNSKDWVVAYYSRKMIKEERNYNIHDKELLAIVKALKE